MAQASQMGQYQAILQELHLQNSNHRVPVKLVKRSLLKENVRLVDQDDGIPAGSNLKDLCQSLVKLRSCDAQFPSANNIKRPFNVLRSRFSRESLSCIERSVRSGYLQTLRITYRHQEARKG